MLKQPQYEPLSLGQQVAILYAGANGYLDDVPVEKIADFERALHLQLQATAAGVIETIDRTGEVDDDTEEQLKAAIEQFKGSVAY